MKQLGLSIPLFVKKPKQTRRQPFLQEMAQTVPWRAWKNRIAPHYPTAGRARRPFPLATMLRIHPMQHGFGYSDPAMEEALHDIPLLREFAGLDAGEGGPAERGDDSRVPASVGAPSTGAGALR